MGVAMASSSSPLLLPSDGVRHCLGCLQGLAVSLPLLIALQLPSMGLLCAEPSELDPQVVGELAAERPATGLVRAVSRYRIRRAEVGKTGCPALSLCCLEHTRWAMPLTGKPCHRLTVTALAIAASTSKCIML